MKEILKKKTVKIGLLIIVLLVAAVIIGFNVQSAQRQKEYDGHIEAAQKYLTELDYEQAIVEFDKAIAIDPMNVDAYLGKADAYIGMGELQSAIDTLQSGYELTEDERLKTKLDEIEAQLMQMEEAARLAAEEEAEANEIKRLVEEKAVEIQQLRFDLFYGYEHGTVYISDTQVEELCRPLVDLLEQYRALYPNDINGPVDSLPYLYYVLGEYELCLETRKQMHEVELAFWEKIDVLDSVDSRYEFAPKKIVQGIHTDEYDEYDEYGRIIVMKRQPDGHIAREFEYGENGKLAQEKKFYSYDDDYWVTEVYTYEYDSLGRISKIVETRHTTIHSSEWSNDEILTYTYTYNEEGYTKHLYSTDRSFKETVLEYEVDKYGNDTQISFTIIE